MYVLLIRAFWIQQANHLQVDHLSRKCQQKDDEIAEANAMRSNLINAMGLGGLQKPVVMPHRARPSGLPNESQNDPSPPTPSFTDTTEPIRVSPSPKRAKPRKSVRPLALTQSTKRTTRASTQGTSIGTVKRQPLGGISGNTSPCKHAMRSLGTARTPAYPGKVAKTLSEGSEDSTFDGSEMVVGTPGAQRPADDTMPMDGWEETTRSTGW